MLDVIHFQRSPGQRGFSIERLFDDLRAAMPADIRCHRHVAPRPSRGGWQRAISMIMVLVDLLGAVAMFTADTLYQTGQSGMTAAMSPETVQTAVLALSGVIALNIAATVAHHGQRDDQDGE